MSYSSAKTHLLNDAEKFLALEEIYWDPSHDAGWFLKKIEGGLFSMVPYLLNKTI
jgi:hypothetical protein